MLPNRPLISLSHPHSHSNFTLWTHSRQIKWKSWSLANINTHLIKVLPRNVYQSFNFTEPTRGGDQPVTTFFLKLFEKQALFQFNIKRNKETSTKRFGDLRPKGKRKMQIKSQMASTDLICPWKSLHSSLTFINHIKDNTTTCERIFPLERLPKTLKNLLSVLTSKEKWESKNFPKQFFFDK